MKVMDPNHAKDGLTDETFDKGKNHPYNLFKKGNEAIKKKAKGRRASEVDNKPTGFQNEMNLGLGQEIGLVHIPLLTQARLKQKLQYHLMGAGV